MVHILGTVLVFAGGPRGLAAQTRTVTACTPDALGVCAQLQLSAGPSLFSIGIRTLGSTGDPNLPVSIYNLVFGTGAPPVTTGTTTSVGPLASGGATVSDASPWEVFDSGDFLFLSALTNRGVGGCVVGADVNGFGQAATTCGTGQFVTFAFVPTDAFDPALFTILNLEAVGLSDPTQGASCGEASVACLLSNDVTAPNVVPEPATRALLGAGLLGLVAFATTRRRRH